MTPLGLATKVRNYTRQTSATLTDANLLLLLNPVKDEIANLISQRDNTGNLFIVPSLDDLVANQREYAFPADVLNHLYSVELAFATASPLAYVLARPEPDFYNWGYARTEANVVALYTNTEPFYEIQRNAIYVYSGTIASVTDGIRIRYRVFPADLAALTNNTVDLSVDPSTTTFGMPKQSHELWARRAAIEWKTQHPGAVPFSVLDNRYDKDLNMMLNGIVKPDFQGEVFGSIPYDDGSAY